MQEYARAMKTQHDYTMYLNERRPVTEEMLNTLEHRREHIMMLVSRNYDFTAITWKSNKAQFYVGWLLAEHVNVSLNGLRSYQRVYAILFSGDLEVLERLLTPDLYRYITVEMLSYTSDTVFAWLALHGFSFDMCCAQSFQLLRSDSGYFEAAVARAYPMMEKYLSLPMAMMMGQLNTYRDMLIRCHDWKIHE